MIINFHPKEIESKKGKSIIESLSVSGNHTVFHVTDKTAKDMTHGTPTAFAAVMEENIPLRMEKGIFGFCGAVVTMKFHDLA